MSLKVRPWGRPAQLFQKTGIKDWVLLGCVATEQRSVVSAAHLSQYATEITLIQIRDPSPRYGFDEEEAYRERTNDYRSRVNREFSLCDEHLKSSIDRVEAIVDEAIKNCRNVILDITSFPKRWFFVIVRHLLERGVDNLFVCYTLGSGHAQVLSENPEALRALPTFASTEGRTHHDYVFVGVGFQTSGMRTLLNDETANSLQLLFPFPPGPPLSERNWRFAQHVEQLVHQDRNFDTAAGLIKYMQVDSRDVSQCFDVIRMVTQDGSRTSVLVPYGPKPFSLAMCLYSLACESSHMPEVPVFYAQPKRYSDRYTADAKYLPSGEPDSHCYAIVYGGRHFYRF